MRLILVAIGMLAFLVGCGTQMPRPFYVAAAEYPLASVSDIEAGAYLTYEGADFGMDGGSHVFIFSTPSRSRIEVWGSLPVS